MRFAHRMDTSVYRHRGVLGYFLWGKIWVIFNRIWGIWVKSGVFWGMKKAVGLVALRAKTDFLRFGPSGHNK